LQAAAIEVTDSEEVLVARMQSAPMMSSSCWNSCFLTSRFSTMASTMTCADARSGRGGARLRAGSRRRRALGGNLAFFGQLDQCAYHRFAGVGGGAVQGVEQQHADAGLGGDLGDAATHGAGADDAEAKRWRLDVNGHAVLLGVLPAGRPGWAGIAAQEPTRASTRVLSVQAAHVVLALGEVPAHHALGVVAQVVHAEQVVGLDHDEQGFFVGRRVGIGLDRGLRAVDGGDVGFALHVIAGDMHLVRGHGVDQVLHARRGVGCVLAFGILGDQHLEGIEGIARRLGVALGEVLQADVAHQAEVLVEVGEALQVVGVVDVGMVGVQADEAVAGGDRRCHFGLPEIGIGDFQLRLLRIAADRGNGPRASRNT
jgi:hypothetical protein